MARLFLAFYASWLSCNPAQEFALVSRSNSNETCIALGSLERCEKCTSSSQCGGNMHCCPMMKTCIRSSSERCYGATAMCQPPCSESITSSTCHCQNKDFPGAWQKPPCGIPGANVAQPLSLLKGDMIPAASKDHAPGECVPVGSLRVCEKCTSSDQCAGNLYCCPFMKTCVRSPSEKCSGPIAMCHPPCIESLNPSTCSCQNGDFPGAWQKSLCHAPQVGMNESSDTQEPVVVVSNLSSAGSCIPPNSLGRCERCFSSEQCGGNMHCCPFMKTCIRSGYEQCYGSIAMCQPPCSDSEDPNSCRCRNRAFPSEWQKPSCDLSRLYASWPLQLAAYRRHVSYLWVLLPGALATTVALVRCMTVQVSAQHVKATEERGHGCTDDLLLVNQA